jgi:hypothetical protein
MATSRTQWSPHGMSTAPLREVCSSDPEAGKVGQWLQSIRALADPAGFEVPENLTGRSHQLAVSEACAAAKTVYAEPRTRAGKPRTCCPAPGYWNIIISQILLLKPFVVSQAPCLCHLPFPKQPENLAQEEPLKSGYRHSAISACHVDWGSVNRLYCRRDVP